MSVIINGTRYVPQLDLTMPPEFGTFGAALKHMRKGLKLSLDKAAMEIGCSKSYLWDLEHDNHEPRLSMTIKIAKAYGVPFLTLAACWRDAE